MQVELDDEACGPGGEAQLRRQRLGEGGEVGSFVGLEAAGVENPAEVRVFGEWPVTSIWTLLWKLGAGA